MKKLVFLVMIILGLGAWMGINFARGKPLFSDPFAEKEMQQRAKQTAKDLLEKSKQAIGKN